MVQVPGFLSSELRWWQKACSRRSSLRCGFQGLDMYNHSPNIFIPKSKASLEKKDGLILGVSLYFCKPDFRLNFSYSSDCRERSLSLKMNRRWQSSSIIRTSLHGNHQKFLSCASQYLVPRSRESPLKQQHCLKNTTWCILTHNSWLITTSAAKPPSETR